jgi:DNA-cytosine methyltransferase
MLEDSSVQIGNNTIAVMSCVDADEKDPSESTTNNIGGVVLDDDPESCCSPTVVPRTKTTTPSTVPTTGVILPPQLFENVLVVPQRLTKHAQNILFPLRASPLSFHLEGRFGGRTHRIDDSHMGIPILDSIDTVLDLASQHNELDNLIHHTDDVRICHNEYMPPSKHRAREPPEIDGRIHPERQQPQQVVPTTMNISTRFMTEGLHSSTSSSSSSSSSPVLKKQRMPPPPTTTFLSSQHRLDQYLFTYAELFAGMGGFGVALDALGGRCVFCSELEEHLRAVYKHNFVTLPNQRLQEAPQQQQDGRNICKTEQQDAPPPPPVVFDIPIFGDIYQVDDADFPSSLDLLVGGFPCQPFSALGEQPGLDCPKNRGHLFQQIVRCLMISKPKAFILENVPGLLTMPDTYTIIVQALVDAGYDVTVEVCSSRGLTATSRKRLFFIGLRKAVMDDVVLSSSTKTTTTTTATHGENVDDDNEFSPTTTADMSYSNISPHSTIPTAATTGKTFEFPFIPDLQLRSRDVLDYDDLPAEELEILRLSEDTFQQLLNRGRWRPHDLAWPNKTCETIISHYGNAVGRGESQLVPCTAPNNPRRFSVRECARLMGFPDTYEFLPPRQHQSPMGYRKEQYRMIGNAVCPPLVAALAGAVLHHIHFDNDPTLNEWDWVQRGRDIAIQLAISATRPKPARLPRGCLLPNEYAKYESRRLAEPQYTNVLSNGMVS